MKMTEIGDIIYLDLNKVDLYGWEDKKSRSVVFYISRKALAGDEFPAVPVIKLNDQEYELSYFANRKLTVEGQTKIIAEGGHHRASGFCIADRDLKCVLDYRNQNIPRGHRKNIKQIVLLDDQKALKEHRMTLGLARKIDKNYSK
jgi:hypothetical protein